jgi:hypothetical protein
MLLLLDHPRRVTEVRLRANVGQYNPLPHHYFDVSIFPVGFFVGD